jgi:hypothetical protein
VWCTRGLNWDRQSWTNSILILFSVLKVLYFTFEWHTATTNDLCFSNFTSNKCLHFYFTFRNIEWNEKVVSRRSDFRRRTCWDLQDHFIQIKKDRMYCPFTYCMLLCFRCDYKYADDCFDYVCIYDLTPDIVCHNPSCHPKPIIYISTPACTIPYMLF